MLTTWNKNGNGLGVWLAWTTIGRMTSWCGNPAKGDEIEADPKSAGLKRSTNISAKRRIGPKWQKMAPSGWTWRRPSSGVAEHGGGLHPEWLNMEEAFIRSGWTWRRPSSRVDSRWLPMMMMQMGVHCTSDRGKVKVVSKIRKPHLSYSVVSTSDTVTATSQTDLLTPKTCMPYIPTIV